MTRAPARTWVMSPTRRNWTRCSLPSRPWPTGRGSVRRRPGSAGAGSGHRSPGPWKRIAQLHMSSSHRPRRMAQPSEPFNTMMADRQEAAIGDGPVHAIAAAIERATGRPRSDLSDFQVRSIDHRRARTGRGAAWNLQHEGREVPRRRYLHRHLEAAALAAIEVVNRIERTSPLAPGIVRPRRRPHLRSTSPAQSA